MTIGKRFLIVDLFSGSYNINNVGFELFNDILNPLTQKYYGYIPPLDNPVLTKLGGSKKDSYVDNILVVFVTRISDNSSDRIITGFYPAARIYNKSKTISNLGRDFTDRDGSLRIAPYSVESDYYIPVPSEKSMVITTSVINPYAFRGQRIYNGRYPELDSSILSFINSFLETEEIDESNMGNVQVIEVTPDIQSLSLAYKRPVKLDPISKIKKVMRNPLLPRKSIEKVGYKCEYEEKHISFLNYQGNNYMEGHHLIPCTYTNAEKLWNKFKINIDCIENIVSLCPNCHRAIHFGLPEEKKKILEVLIVKHLPMLKNLGLELTGSDIFSYYGLSDGN